MAQNSTVFSTTPSASPSPSPHAATVTATPTVTISQEDADRCANNTRELVAARAEIQTYVSEVAARQQRDANTDKLLATYDRALDALDKVIAAQNNLSADKTDLLRAQTDLIKTLMQMPKNKSSPLKSVFNLLTGFFLGRGFN